MTLIRALVQPPLQKLDLQRITEHFLTGFDNVSQEVSGKEWFLRIVLANFAGVELKLSHLEPMCHMPSEVLDFEWACSQTLKYFKMHNCRAISDKMMLVICKRLA